MIDICYNFNNEKKIIKFKIDGKEIEISYENDIDLTDVIKLMTSIIDKEELLNDISEIQDINLNDKEKVINDAIKDVIKNFNEVINQEDIKSDELSDESDDMPF